MLDLVENHIVGFPTRWLNYAVCADILLFIDSVSSLN